MKRILFSIGSSVTGAIIGVAIFSAFFLPEQKETFPAKTQKLTEFHFAKYTADRISNEGMLDFTIAADISTPAVVHVKNTFMASRSSGNPFYDFFSNPHGGPQSRQMSSGSGVVIRGDGYIVTNYHVVKNADKLEVTLFDKRSYPAEIIGTDPNTDLALIRIKEENLPFLEFALSDEIKVGEWVLAVGNPFDLTSTVTAGIVSAKGRNINILNNQANAPIEAFIQTDAAVNPGNSGGALVNLKGELVGINTAIATPTGTYAGYSFAVPSSIVNKVVTDLMEYGVVQRGYLGVSIADINSKLAERYDLENLNGVYVAEVIPGGGADEAGIETGDVVTQINDISVTSVPHLQEVVSRYKPGDQIKVDFFRDGRLKSTSVTLKNRMNNTELLSKNSVSTISLLGVNLEALSEEEMEKFRIRGGIRVAEVHEGKFRRNTNIKEGFIITKIDHQIMDSVEDAEKILHAKRSGEGVLIEGFYPEYPHKTHYFAFGY